MIITRQSETDVLRRVLIKHPREAWVSSDAIEEQWEALDYLSQPDFARAREEFEALAACLESFDIQVEHLPHDPTTGMDSIYPRDASIVCDRGVIQCRMGKDARRAEPSAQQGPLESLGLPVVGAITGSGTVEGGDVAWLDPQTLAVGRGYRTNDEGIRQLREILGSEIDVVEVALPHWRGPRDVFHLMSILSPIDRDVALVYSPLMSVSFRELLLERGMTLVEVPDEEYDSMATNVLTVAPRVCLQLEGNPVTRRRLEKAGVTVVPIAGAEISAKGCGGPTCLTRPLEREYQAP